MSEVWKEIRFYFPKASSLNDQNSIIQNKLSRNSALWDLTEQGWVMDYIYWNISVENFVKKLNIFSFCTYFLCSVESISLIDIVFTVDHPENLVVGVDDAACVV